MMTLTRRSSAPERDFTSGRRRSSSGFSGGAGNSEPTIRLRRFVDARVKVVPDPPVCRVTEEDATSCTEPRLCHVTSIRHGKSWTSSSSRRAKVIGRIGARASLHYWKMKSSVTNLECYVFAEKTGNGGWNYITVTGDERPLVFNSRHTELPGSVDMDRREETGDHRFFYLVKSPLVDNSGGFLKSAKFPDISVSLVGDEDVAVMRYHDDTSAYTWQILDA